MDFEKLENEGDEIVENNEEMTKINRFLSESVDVFQNCTDFKSLEKSIYTNRENLKKVLNVEVIDDSTVAGKIMTTMNRLSIHCHYREKGLLEGDTEINVEFREENSEMMKIVKKEIEEDYSEDTKKYFEAILKKIEGFIAGAGDENKKPENLK